MADDDEAVARVGAAQPRQGRARQLRRSAVKRTLTTDDSSRKKAPAGGKEYSLARARQGRTVKQARAVAVPTDIRPPVIKTALARAVQSRQLASAKPVRLGRIAGTDVAAVPKVMVARIAQGRQMAAAKVQRDTAT